MRYVVGFLMVKPLLRNFLELLIIILDTWFEKLSLIPDLKS
jgi:hypothetical protein